MADIYDCVIKWSPARLVLVHVPSGYEVARENVLLRSPWPIDDMFGQLDAMLKEAEGKEEPCVNT